MNQEPLLGGVTGRLRALPKTTFRDPSAVELLERSLRSTEDEFQRYDGFMTLVKILIEEHHFIAAEKVILSCSDFSENDRGEFLGKLGLQLGLHGQRTIGTEKLAEARNLVLKLELDEWGWAQAERLGEIADHYIALDESPLAIAVLSQATSLCQKVLQKSLELDDPQNTHDSASVLRQIARVFEQLGENDRAKQIADAMPNDMWRGYILRSLTNSSS